MSAMTEAMDASGSRTRSPQSPAAKLLWLALLAVFVAGGYYLWRNWDRLTVWPQKKEAMVAAMRDPSSVQFREERLRAGGFLCGEMNAKNAMGGYVGFKRFAAFEGGYVLEGHSISSWPRDLREANGKLKLVELEANWLKTSAEVLNKPFDEEPFNTKRFEAVWESACG